MPVLEKKSKIERLYLPSTKHLPEDQQAFVDMETGPMTTGDIIDVDPKAGEVEIGVRMLVSRVKGWNFTNAEGSELEISFESLQLLDMEDFAFLAAKIPQNTEALTAQEKKT
jgi:hypothetical protein